MCGGQSLIPVLPSGTDVAGERRRTRSSAGLLMNLRSSVFFPSHRASIQTAEITRAAALRRDKSASVEVKLLAGNSVS